MITNPSNNIKWYTTTNIILEATAGHVLEDEGEGAVFEVGAFEGDEAGAREAGEDADLLEDLGRFLGGRKEVRFFKGWREVEWSLSR